MVGWNLLLLIDRSVEIDDLDENVVGETTIAGSVGLDFKSVQGHQQLHPLNMSSRSKGPKLVIVG